MRVLQPRITAVPFLGPRLGAGPSGVILIVGAMRTGSTLLMHLLAEHPQIAGFGEAWVRYGCRRDFAELRARVELYRWLERRLSGRRAPTPRWVCDKLLHGPLLVDATALTEPTLRIVFLVRDPHVVISSMMGSNLPVPHGQSTQSAAAYVVRRLNRMRDLAQAVPNPSHARLVRYERLVDEPDAVLADLTTFLALDSPLRPTYRTRLTTGVPILGDSSRLIRSGTVRRGHRREPRDVGASLLRTCDAAMRELVAVTEARRIRHAGARSP